MNSEQILLLVAALGVVAIVVTTAISSKKKPTPSESGRAITDHPRRFNRAQRRKR